jgi:2-C-methyl-D-erythritol 4-phosphate cytidylyltransferase/2-C-methyl-D-erythritol 2,4-cyclodiphosphate synthase
MKIIALIVSGGEGKRFDKKFPKQFFCINGKSILEISVSNFYNSCLFDKIIVVSNKKFLKKTKDILNNYDADIVVGGTTRQSSVLKGLEKANKYKPNKVIIHDAVRPFFSNKTLNKIVTHLDHFDCVVPSLKIFDSVRHYENKVYRNLDRDKLKLIQTPQGFKFNTIFNAHQKFKDEQFTDDSMLAYRNECRIKFIDGEILNFKVTKKKDYEIIKKMMESKPNNSVLKVGNGFDVHKLINGKFIKLLGIQIPFNKKLEGHSDADVGIHAIVDSILGALSKGDIGDYFPPSEEKWKNKDSKYFLKYSKKILDDEKYIINNIDITLICEKPKISSYKKKMKKVIASILDIKENIINIKATTTEKLGFLGREEGIACQVLTTISKI